MALPTTSTIHPCISRQPRITQIPGLPTSLAPIEADIVQGSCNSVMLIGMSKSPALPGAGDVKHFLVVPTVTLLELLADWSVCASTGLDQRALPVQRAFHYTFYNRYINSDMCPSHTRPSTSTSSHGFDVQLADLLEPVCSLSLVDAYRHASTTTSVGRTKVVGAIGSGGSKEHNSVEEMLCIDCISQRSGVSFVHFSFLTTCMREGGDGRG